MGASFPVDILSVAPSVSSFCPLDFQAKFMQTESLRFLQWFKAFNSSFSQVLQKSVIIGVIEGGDVMEERLRSARETAKRPVGGFLLDGFQGDPAVTETRLHLLSSVTAELPEDKPRPVLDWDAGQPCGWRAEVLVTV